MTGRTFSQDVRTQLAQHDPERACCKRSQLLAMFSVCAVEAEGAYLVMTVENGAVARMLFRLAKDVFGEAPRLASPEALGRTGVYRLWVRPEMAEGDSTASLDAIRREIRKRSCCRRAFLRGAFLGCGSIVDPERAYHLEFTAPGEVSAWIVALLERESVHAGHYQRAGHSHWTAYVKRSEDIARFLTLVGAVPALLALEELLISRDLKNNVQRAVNCETANLDRTVTTAQEQIALIEDLDEWGLLSNADEGLQETARLRCEHPYASLAQLADLHVQPLSKSAVNHRLRKLLKMAAAHGSPGIVEPPGGV